MSDVDLIETHISALTACTVTRSVQDFVLLIEEMEDEFGETWGDIALDDALLLLDQDESSGLEVMILAVNAQDTDHADQIKTIVTAAKDRGLKVILVADAIGPADLHKFMRMGADDFLPYPLPESGLHDSLERLRATPAPAAAPSAAKSTGNRDGVVLPIHGLAGGVGATTIAVNLAVEMAALAGKDGQTVCLLDLNFQFGNTATYLDLPRREAVTDLLADVALADEAALLAAMQTYNDGLSVLTAPVDMMPLEIVSAQDVGHLIDMARANFDYVIIDMPSTIVSWTEAVLSRAHVYFALVELDLRSAQNVLRLVRALKAEGLPYEKLRFALNRAPRFTDLSAKSRVKRMAESLDIRLELQLPDGAIAVAQSNDQGLPLMESAPKNPLRKDIMKLAQSLFELNSNAAAAAEKRKA